ncbi:MAG: hypothetical protein ACOC5G_04640 [Acidobacteriota bacterium]
MDPVYPHEAKQSGIKGTSIGVEAPVSTDEVIKVRKLIKKVEPVYLEGALRVQNK